MVVQVASSGTKPIEAVVTLSGSKNEFPVMRKEDRRLVAPGGVARLKLDVDLTQFGSSVSSTDYAQMKRDYPLVIAINPHGEVESPLVIVDMVLRVRFTMKRMRGMFMVVPFGTFSRRVGESLFMYAKSVYNDYPVLHHVFGGNNRFEDYGEFSSLPTNGECEHKMFCACGVAFNGKGIFKGERFVFYPRKGPDNPYLPVAKMMEERYRVVDVPRIIVRRGGFSYSDIVDWLSHDDGTTSWHLLSPQNVCLYFDVTVLDYENCPHDICDCGFYLVGKGALKNLRIQLMIDDLEASLMDASVKIDINVEKNVGAGGYRLKNDDVEVIENYVDDKDHDLDDEVQGKDEGMGLSPTT